MVIESTSPGVKNRNVVFDDLVPDKMDKSQFTKELQEGCIHITTKFNAEEWRMFDENRR